MDPIIENFITSFDPLTSERFKALYQLALESTPHPVEEKLWARLPTISCGEKFIRLIPFKDHINIEANGLAAHKDQLAGYRFTPKGMLQIGHEQDIPVEVLKLIFQESLEESGRKYTRAGA